MTRKTLFHEDWWLDALIPGGWREIACIRGGTRAGFLRFVERSEFGLLTCDMPMLCRMLGPVVEPAAGKAETRLRWEHSVVKDLLDQIDGYSFVRMTLDTSFSDLTPFLAAGYDIKPHPTLLLECGKPKEELWSGLRDKARNVVRRARDHLTVVELDTIEQFTNFYRANLEGDESYFDIGSLNAIFAAASVRNQCRLLAASDASGISHAKVFFVWDDRYVHYYLSSRAKDVAHHGAVSLLLWSGIELAHTLGLDFDFDGGMFDDSKFKFMASFGGRPANRFEISRATAAYRAQSLVRRAPRAIGRLCRLNGRLGIAPSAGRPRQGPQPIADQNRPVTP